MNNLVLFSKCLVIAEVLAAITGLITWNKWKCSYLKWVPIYLFIISALEVSFYLFDHYHQLSVGRLIHEIQPPVEMLFLNWFFYRTLNNKVKNLVFICATIYITVLVLEKTLFQNNTYYFQSLSYTFGNLFILIYLIIFFIELVKSNNLFIFKRLTVFWIACGMLIFYLGTFPFYGLYNELAKDLDVFMPVAWVATSLNYCMYLLFTIGFIWGKPH